MPKGTVVRREVHGCRLLSVNMDKMIQIEVKKNLPFIPRPNGAWDE